MICISLDVNLHCIRSFHSGLTKFTANIMNPIKYKVQQIPYNARVNSKYHLHLGRLSYCFTCKVGSLPIEFCRQFQAFTLLLYAISPEGRQLKPPSSRFFSRLLALDENPVYRPPFNPVKSRNNSSCLYDRNLFPYCCILLLTNYY